MKKLFVTVLFAGFLCLIPKLIYSQVELVSAAASPDLGVIKQIEKNGSGFIAINEANQMFSLDSNMNIITQILLPDNVYLQQFNLLVSDGNIYVLFKTQESIINVQDSIIALSGASYTFETNSLRSIILKFSGNLQYIDYFYNSQFLVNDFSIWNGHFYLVGIFGEPSYYRGCLAKVNTNFDSDSIQAIEVEGEESVVRSCYKLYQDSMNGDLFILGRCGFTSNSYQVIGVKYSFDFIFQFKMRSLKTSTTCVDIFGKGHEMIIVYKSMNTPNYADGFYFDYKSTLFGVHNNTLLSGHYCGNGYTSNEIVIGFIPAGCGILTFVLGSNNSPGCSSIDNANCGITPQYKFKSFVQSSNFSFVLNSQVGFVSEPAPNALWSSLVRPVSMLDLGNGEIILNGEYGGEFNFGAGNTLIAPPAPYFCQVKLTEGFTAKYQILFPYLNDSDGDGFVYVEDCDDSNPLINPNVLEICNNGIDEDCSGSDCLIILGCVDSTACNYNDLANTDDNSCILPQTETCNGLDDDCDGQVDEGLTVASVNATSVNTALYPTCSGNALKSANLNNGTNSDLIEGNGLDLWYSLTAQYNTLRASLSAAFGDNEIRLYSYNNGCFELLETEHEVYTTTSVATGNQILISDDLIPGQTYYIAVHNISGSMNPSAKMCFNHFVGTTCDHYYSNNTGIYNNVCTSFKAQYKGNATNYIFDILSATQNNANLNITPWSYTTTTANSVVPRLGTIFPVNMSASAKVYTLRIPVIYAIPDAAGNYTSITANATTTCTVTLNAELPVALRAVDRCPNTKNTTSSISIDRTICGALRYEWEFTQQLPSVQPAVTVLGGLNTTVFFLNNVPGMGTGKTYNVRVRPIHTNGEVGSWGTVQCLKTGTAGMVLENHPGSANAEPPLLSLRAGGERVSYLLYPNPTTNGRFTLTASNTSDEEVMAIKMMDVTGKVVYKTQVVMNGNAVEIEFGNLASGVYVVMVGEERLRLVIQ